MQPIILSGGVGRRLWPISRTKLPKQFIKLVSGLSFFQKTLLRLQKYQPPIIIGNYIHRELIYQQMKEIGVKGLVVLEEKITGTYIPSLFGMVLSHNFGHNIVGIFPTDHFIDDVDNFFYNINQAIILSNSTQIIAFGQRAVFVNEHYGYISAVNDYDNVYIANNFIEKPKKPIIKEAWLSQHFWNLGIFILNTSLLNDILKNDSSIIGCYLKTIDHDKDFVVDKNLYQCLTGGSFDMMVMNQIKNFAMINADFKWMDIGTYKNMFLSCSKYYK